MSRLRIVAAAARVALSATALACGDAGPGGDPADSASPRAAGGDGAPGAASADQSLAAGVADEAPPDVDDTLYPEIRSGLLRRLDPPEPVPEPEGAPDNAARVEPGVPAADPPSGELTTGSEVASSDFCAAVGEWNVEWAALEDEILELVNRVRATGTTCGGEPRPPVAPLAQDPELRCAARVHSLDMARREFFDHVNPDGDGPGERAGSAGFSGRTIGENIAGGSATAEGTMAQWLDSPGHCDNVMRAGYAWLGVGYYPGGLYRYTWTQVFGG